jgi:putative chitinase
MIDRDKFFTSVRASLFGGSLSQSQVDGMNYLLNIWEAFFEKPNPRDGNNWLAYCLATVFHETGKAMIPVEEVGKGGGQPYGAPTGPYNKAYYGRGHVQLTWEDNYKKGQSQLLKNYGLEVAIYPQPDLMLEDRPSALILYDGMSVGWFTGVGLPQYFNSTTEDPYNARKIVNGLDQASAIQGYYEQFKSAIVTVSGPSPGPEPPPETMPPVVTISADTPVFIKLGVNVALLESA